MMDIGIFIHIHCKKGIHFLQQIQKRKPYYQHYTVVKDQNHLEMVRLSVYCG